MKKTNKSIFFPSPCLFHLLIVREAGAGLRSVWPRADEKAQSHASDNRVIAHIMMELSAIEK